MATTLIDPRGRAKAYRPIAAPARAEALRAFFEAYDAGEFYEAHELLEPAWMGSPDAGERELYSGLIKLAAAFVHNARPNAAGTIKNLRGARVRLAGSKVAKPPVDVAAILTAIDASLATLGGGAARVEPIPLRRLP